MILSFPQTHPKKETPRSLMFPEAVARYHDLLADQKLADDSATLLNEGLEHAKLIFGGRRLSPYLRPHFVTETDFARITTVCETVWSAIQKVKDAAITDESIVNDLGLTDIERDRSRLRGRVTDIPS